MLLQGYLLLFCIGWVVETVHCRCPSSAEDLPVFSTTTPSVLLCARIYDGSNPDPSRSCTGYWKDILNREKVYDARDVLTDNDRRLSWNDIISAIVVRPGCQLRVGYAAQFRGRTFTFEPGVHHHLATMGWDNSISSWSCNCFIRKAAFQCNDYHDYYKTLTTCHRERNIPHMSCDYQMWRGLRIGDSFTEGQSESTTNGVKASAEATIKKVFKVGVEASHSLTTSHDWSTTINTETSELVKQTATCQVARGQTIHIRQPVVECGDSGTAFYASNYECVEDISACGMPEDNVLKISTPDAYGYTYLDNHGIQHGVEFKRMKFCVRASNDVHINLADDKSNQDTIEIVIGGWGNTKSVIRFRRRQVQTVVETFGAQLDAFAYTTFWVSWWGGHIQVGRGSIIGDRVFMSATKMQEVNYVGISTGWGSSGSWVLEKRDVCSFLVSEGIRTAQEVESYSQDDCRNTLINKLSVTTSNSLQQLQAMSNEELVQTYQHERTRGWACAVGYTKIRNSCYSSHGSKILTGSDWKSWDDARTDCRSRGGHLLWIQNIAKWNELTEYINAHVKRCGYFWIWVGARDADGNGERREGYRGEGRWRWEDGQALNLPGLTWVSSRSGDCLEVYPGTSSRSLYAYDCHWTAPYICEYD